MYFCCKMSFLRVVRRRNGLLLECLTHSYKISVASLNNECDWETLPNHQLVHNDEENRNVKMSSNLECTVSCYLHNV
jgi:hypothetical protein